jgi:CheY-like chemotaxis protein
MLNKQTFPGDEEMTILAVDDDEGQRLMLNTLLRLEGWDVFLAEDGEEALKKIALAKMDIIISDIYMPVMDGFKLRNTVRGMPGNETLPFLFISGYDDQYTLQAVKNPKIEGFFRKGKPVGELKEWVLYLTAPEEKRPKYPPGQKPKLSSFDPNRDRSHDSRR